LKGFTKLCIIVYKPEDVRLSEEHLFNCFFSNSDGAGFLAWDSDKNQLICEKGFFSIKALEDAFEPHQDKRSIIHFRIGTHGEKNAENCHPFLIRNGLGFAHNGIIHLDINDKSMSDTWHFNKMLKTYLSYYPDAWEIDRFNAYFKFLKADIGWSKFAFMDKYGYVHIYGEEQGVWDSGCWFSNYTYTFNRFQNIYTGHGVYSGVHRYGGGYPANSINLYEDSVKEAQKEYEDLFPIDVCPICQVEYKNWYNNWVEDINEFVCDDCMNKMNDLDVIDEATKPTSSLMLDKILEEITDK
jgi:hypothetical protein